MRGASGPCYSPGMRLKAFHALKDHPWYGRYYKKLTPADVTYAEWFMVYYYGCDKGVFEAAVNRMFVDKDKPRNWAVISELLAAANV